MSDVRRIQRLATLAAGDWRVVHLWLHAVCEAHAPEVLNALRVEPEASRDATEQYWSDAVGGGVAGLTVAIANLGLLPGTARWVQLAALLRALDEHHTAVPSRLSASPWCPPAHLHDEMIAGGWYLLAPPAPQDASVPRDGGDMAPTVHARLGLRCNVVRPAPECPVRPQFQRAPAALVHLFGPVRTGAELVVAMASPAAAVAMEVTGEPGNPDYRDRVPYRFQAWASADLDAADKLLGRVLAAAEAAGAHVLLLPELEVPPPLVARLAARLRAARGCVALVVAGSYHVEAEGHFRNRATVLTGFGEVLWHHDKCVDFGIPPGEAATMPIAMLAQLGIDARGGCEGICVGEELVVCELPFGRLSVATCLDYCGGHLDPLFVAAGVNLVMVPAMTASTEAFRTRAHDLGTRARALAWIVNSGWLRALCGGGEKCASAMVYRPVHQGWRQTAASPDPVIVCRDGEVKPANH